MGILDRQWNKIESCDEVKIVREFIYLGNMVRAGRGCDAVVSARTRCRWAKFKECNELLYDGFPQKLKWAVYKCYVRPAIMYGREALCREEKHCAGKKARW